MKALLLLPALLAAGALGFLLAACGGDGAATPAGPVPTAGPTAGGTTEEAPASSTGETATDRDPAVYPGETALELWFTNAEGLFLTYRTVESTPRIGTAALEELLAGPDDYESAYGLGTAIPEGTRLLGLTIEDGIARVDLTSEFETGGGSASMQMRLAQIVFTTTQFPTVKGVVFSLDGRPIDVLGGEGVIVDQPLTRDDFEEQLPAILVMNPALGQHLRGRVIVGGTANVFEANVSIQVLDETGAVIAETFTTATCGTGCRGSFGTELRFSVDREQKGTVVVHDDDAAGVGRPPHEVRIPVRLLP